MLRYLKEEDSEAKKNKLAEKVSETLYSNELMDFFFINYSIFGRKSDPNLFADYTFLLVTRLFICVLENIFR